MKKIGLSLFVSLLFLSSVIAIPMPPMPIAGRIDGGVASVDNLKVVLYNQRTGESRIVYSNPAGEWLVDWANSDLGYAGDDKIDITIWMCKDNSICKKTVIIEGNPITVTFDISSLLYQCPECICPECPTTTTTPITTTTISCPDPTSYCGEIEDLCTDEVLAICETMNDCPECPDATISSIVGAIIGAIASLGIYRYGLGYKVYTKRSGEVVGLHKHPGIIAYHDPQISHKNPKIRHPKGMITPKYKKDTSGKWYYVGE